MLKRGQYAAGSLNFRDVMLAYGKLSKDLMSHGHGGHQIGLEFSGKVPIQHTASAYLCDISCATMLSGRVQPENLC